MPGHAHAPGTRKPTVVPKTHRWFSALFVAHTLEGIGYFIAGTFLVASIEQTSPGWIGSGAWVLVGLAAIPGDVGEIAARTGYHYRFGTVIYRGAPLPCKSPKGGASSAAPC
ncbi:YbfB/YjiJ family MFS transporter [Streptomyces sp. HC307]|uniref:YbfB/YjiJ family MFS transporter n=1 Tax=Streptomyces flavusporus TaxID=3385496 RepID=UPI003916F5B8